MCQSVRSHPSPSLGASIASQTSSAVGRAKAAARKAVLEAQAAVLKMLQAIEQEELLSRQRKNDLKIKTELVKAWAKKHGYCSKSKGEKSVQIHRTQVVKIRNYLRLSNSQ